MNSKSSNHHQLRVVCLCAEAAEILFRLGKWESVVGVSAYAQNHVPRKPVISGFSSGNIGRILELAPDLAITFSDVQAKLAEELIRSGCRVLALNHWCLKEIECSICLLGYMLDAGAAARQIVANLRAELRECSRSWEYRPKVFFEEWNDPIVSGAGWIQEIIELAGGKCLFTDRSTRKAAGRVVAGDEIVAARPDIVLVSWCGKAISISEIASRPGFAHLPAVRNGEIYELDPAGILQAGPRLGEGARVIQKIIQNWVERRQFPGIEQNLE